MRVALLKLLGVAILVLTIVAGWLYIEYSRFANTPLNVSVEESELVIKPGMTLYTLASNLEQKGIIGSARHFRWMARLDGTANRIQAGTYRLKQGMTPSLLLRDIVEGRVEQFAITLLEGWNFRQLIEAVHANPNLTHTLVNLGDGEVMAKLGYAGEHPEGRFFPDTYSFPKGMTDVALLQRAYLAMSRYLAEEWERRDADLPYESPYQALIMASIVEKETGVAAERGQIAGVFVRRLQKGMLLQTDPTVIYGVGVNFDGNLRKRDLLADNPYNTYRKKGLPPTPIAMPGRDAIRAALHPAGGDALYFVAKGDGSSHFSATLQEHESAVDRYQRRARVETYRSRPESSRK